MSTTALTWAFGQATGSPVTKAVLVALADQADDATYACYPGQELISARTELGGRTVRRALKDLELAGFLTRERRFDSLGHRTSDWYILPVMITVGKVKPYRPERPVARAASGRSVQSLPATQAVPTGRSGQVTRSEPSVEPEEENSAPTAKNKKPSPFEQFWDVYPRKAGKAVAETKFKLALTKASFEEILAGAVRLRDDPNRDPEFTAHPSTWLFQGRWADDPLPDRRSALRPEPVKPDFVTRREEQEAAMRHQQAVIGGLR